MVGESDEDFDGISSHLEVGSTQTVKRQRKLRGGLLSFRYETAEVSHS